MTAPRSAPTVLQIVLGRRLALLRDGAGLTAAEAATRVRVDQTTITRMEKAETSLKWATVKALLELYGAGPAETEEFLALTEQANAPGWWQSFRDVLPSWFGVHVSLEGAAARIHTYEPQVIPGLLQTKEYAHAVLRSGLPRVTADVVERRVSLRLKRQDILTRTEPEPPRLWAVMDETCLRRTVGSRAVMCGQIDQLLRMAELPNVTLRICPFEAGLHPGGFGPFTVFRFEIPELPDVVCVDTLSRGQYSEDPEEVALFREALDHMSTYALSSARTRQFLMDVRDELTRSTSPR
ncbi:helix-turn-helix domain-containing protein [Streptomyces sp. NPDC059063]|uniref:helix-turn-helix domain-containing protein n=1 Tax=unclassified Streptomyces TaxID=2593676 RepID=UPI0036A104A8